MCPRERTEMYSLREILRLSLEFKLSANEIHRRTGASRGVVQDCIKAARVANIDWSRAMQLDDITLKGHTFSRETKRRAYPLSSRIGAGSGRNSENAG